MCTVQLLAGLLLGTLARGAPCGTPAEHAQLAVVFVRLDADRDGVLIWPEIGRATGLTDPELAELLVQVDSSGDGNLGLDEFVCWQLRQPPDQRRQLAEQAARTPPPEPVARPARELPPRLGQLPAGAVLDRLYLTRSSRQANRTVTLGSVVLRSGVPGREQLEEPCRAWGASPAECERIEHGPVARVIKQETERREKQLVALSLPDQELQYSLAIALEMHATAAIRLIREQLRGMQLDRAVRVLYQAWDTAMGWPGNAGMNKRGLWEGYTSPEAAVAIAERAHRERACQVCELGFNAGHSAASLLLASWGTNCKVVSFDLADKPYTELAERLVLQAFGPDRFELVRGRSQQTVPEVYRTRPGLSCDMIFIDGDHSTHGALADIKNMRALAGCNATVVVDDYDLPGVAQALDLAQDEQIFASMSNTSRYILAKYRQEFRCVTIKTEL